MSGKYDDIINCERPKSGRQKMSLNDRAAQFSPFAALTGFEDEIDETNRQTEEMPEYSEDAQQEIDRVLCEAEAEIENKNENGSGNEKGNAPVLEVEYFIPDEKKSGGRIVVKTGEIKKIDRQNGKVVFTDGEFISFRRMLACRKIKKK